MNRKQFLALVVVGLVVGGFAWYSLQQRKQSYTTSDVKGGQKVAPDFPLNDIAHLRIRGATGEVNVVKQNDQWVVRERGDYPASITEVGGFLRKMWDLKPVQELAIGPSQFGRLDLVAPGDNPGATNTATMVEFKGADGKNLQTVLFGKKYVKESGNASPFGGGGDFPVGRYLTVQEQAPPRVWLVSETFNNIEPKPQDWLNKDFFKVEKIRLITVKHPEETNSWTLMRETDSGEWKFAEAKEGEKADTSKTSSLNYAFSSPTFNDVADPNAKPETLHLDKPVTARIETFEGFIYNLKVGGNTNEENYSLQVKVEANFDTNRVVAANETAEEKEKLEKEHKEKIDKLQEKLRKEQGFSKWTYLVSKWTVDNVLKTRKDFLADPKAEASPEPSGSPLPGINPDDLIPDEIKQLPVAPPEAKAQNQDASPGEGSAPTDTKRDQVPTPEE